LTVALVFARMDSQRLPGKALADLGGRPLLDRVVDRVARARAVSGIVVATSDRPVDDPIAARATALGVEIFRGSADDVAQRALSCCTSRGIDAFLRISGDSPFLAPEAIDGVATLFAAEAPDIATNVHPRTFPPGCSAELIRVGALARALPAMAAADREHVTPYFYRNADLFRIANLRSDVAYDGVRLTVDTADELARARWVVAETGLAPETRSLGDIVALVRAFDAMGARAAS
jgi:spore coat polysaccharide biosynthesis protein SpsF